MRLPLFCGSPAIISLPGFTLFFIHLPIHTLESAQFTVTGPDQPIIAIVEEDVVLPCHLSPTMNAEDMEVRWFRSDFSSPVHLYRYGKDQYEQQMPEYTGRTDFLRDGIQDGRVALRLCKVTPADEGQYKCYFQSAAFYGDAILELQLSALLLSSLWRITRMEGSELSADQLGGTQSLKFSGKILLDVGCRRCLKHNLEGIMASLK